MSFGNIFALKTLVNNILGDGCLHFTTRKIWLLKLFFLNCKKNAKKEY